ncbi:MAG: response regulator [Nibricoccus sp.]
MKILIVDDRPNLARVTIFALRGLGCEALWARSVAEAESCLENSDMDAVFLDVNLDQENGFDYLSRLVVQRPQLPVIMFSAQSRDEILEESNQRGAFGCITKPFGLEELRAMINRLQLHASSR